jgi:hypothetical protein
MVQRDKLTIFIYSCLLRNELLFSYATEAFSAIERHRVYRQEIKKATRDAKQELRRYDRFVEHEITIENDKRDLLDSISDLYRIELEDSINGYAKLIDNEFFDLRKDDVELIKKVFLVSVLINFACYRIDGDIAHERDISAKLKRLTYLRPTAMQHKWEVLSNSIYSKLHIDWSSTNKDNFKEAFKCLDEKFANYNLVGKVLREIKVR